jgi:hypothetical protein
VHCPYGNKNAGRKMKSEIQREGKPAPEGCCARKGCVKLASILLVLTFAPLVGYCWKSVAALKGRGTFGEVSQK